VEFCCTYAGSDFGPGLYRLHTPASSAEAAGYVRAGFGDDLSEPFAFDWLGCQYLCAGREVLLADPGSAEVLRVPFDVERFHLDELVNRGDEALAQSAFRHYLRAGGRPPSFDECVGLVQPLYLGGTDGISNMELIDIDVYWSLASQIMVAASSAPEGERLGFHVQDEAGSGTS
jgi:hypothetical protein